MSASLVQSALAGNASGSFTTVGGQVLTATGNFGSNTGAGNLLVLIAYDTQTRTSGSGFAPASFTVTTSGVTWINPVSAGVGDIGTVRSGAALYCAGNAGSVSSATTVTVQYTASSSSANGTFAIEFALYEFSGIAASSSGATGGALIDVVGTHNTQAGGNPNVSLTPAHTDLIVTFFKGNSSNATAPATYNLGQNMAVVTVGQMAWNGSVSAGAQTPTWTGAQTNWGNSAIAFRLLATVGTTQAFFFG